MTPRSPETRAKISAKLKGRRLTPEHCANMKAARAANPVRRTPEQNAAHAEKMRAKGHMKRMWQDPAFAAAMRKRSSDAMKKRWEDAEFARRTQERLAAWRNRCQPINEEHARRILAVRNAPVGQKNRYHRELKQWVTEQLRGA